ncbi:MAG TPA: response regulator transcription factor [Candidatus Limnocylindrales bacterium]|nr:response regulator transcription factor [Candidatus Limnocylindrales bacterium]
MDDHPVVAEGTAAVLRGAGDLQVVGVAPSIESAEAAGLFDGGRIDVLLLDIRLGPDSGLRALGGDQDPHRPAVIVLTAYDYPQYADAALRLGAAGFVLKTAPLAELIDAIQCVASGGLAFSIRPGGASITRLSPREHDVVRLVAAGRSNDEIGADLGIGSKTVETHLARLFERLGVASRTELAMRAIREGWLDVPPGRA